MQALCKRNGIILAFQIYTAYHVELKLTAAQKLKLFSMQHFQTEKNFENILKL